MKNSLYFWIILLLLGSLALVGCNRNNNRDQGASNPADANNPPAAATLAPAPAQAVPVAAPTDTLAPQPTAEATLAPAATQPPAAVLPTTDTAAINQAADDLSSALDGLTKDLDATDTLNDVK